MEPHKSDEEVSGFKSGSLSSSDENDPPKQAPPSPAPTTAATGKASSPSPAGSNVPSLGDKKSNSGTCPIVFSACSTTKNSISGSTPPVASVQPKSARGAAQPYRSSPGLSPKSETTGPKPSSGMKSGKKGNTATDTKPNKVSKKTPLPSYYREQVFSQKPAYKNDTKPCKSPQHVHNPIGEQEGSRVYARPKFTDQERESIIALNPIKTASSRKPTTPRGQSNAADKATGDTSNTSKSTSSNTGSSVFSTPGSTTQGSTTHGSSTKGSIAPAVKEESFSSEQPSVLSANTATTEGSSRGSFSQSENSSVQPSVISKGSTAEGSVQSEKSQPPSSK